MAFFGEGAWQEGQTLTFGGAATLTWTGIPTDAKFVRLVFQNVTVNNGSTPHIAMRVGNNTTDSGNNYDWRIRDTASGGTQGANNTSDIRITHTNHSDTAHVWYGILDFHFLNGEHTNVNMSVWSRYPHSSDNHLEHGMARWTGSSDMERIALFKPNGANYTGGRGTVYYLI